MSALSDASADAAIEVVAPLGTQITLADGGFATVAEAVTEMSGRHRDGTYSLRLSAGERSRQWIVRLRSGKTWRFPDDLPLLRDGSRDDGSVADPRFAEAARHLAARADWAGSEIAVLVTTADFEPEADFSRFVRLGGHDDPGEASAPPFSCETLPNGSALLRFRASPGGHLLNIETFERKRIDQPVMVFTGRRTIVLLEYGQASIVEQMHGSKRVRKRRGINPVRTVIISQNHGTDAGDLAERFGIADILLFLLRTRIKPVDVPVAQALTGFGVDPLLKLYAAAGCIALPGTVIQRLATSIRKTAMPDGTTFAQFVAQDLHRELAHETRWADVICLGWRLGGRDDNRLLPAMPMLELSWRWAAAHSARFGLTSIVDPAAPGANRQTEADASPWLTITSTLLAPRPDNLPELAAIAPDLAAMANNLGAALSSGVEVQKDSAPGHEATVSLDLSLLTVSTARLVQAIANTGGGVRWSEGGEELLPHLAASLGEPLGTLGTTIRQAAAEIQELVDRQAADPDNILQSDPHKGAFGGRPECGGARVELETVTKRDHIETYALDFVVYTEPGARPLEGPVSFYLHPTFSPSVVTRRPIDGRVSFTCYAWGAFTLGVETADGRRMELDLADEAILPEDFRAR